MADIIAGTSGFLGARVANHPAFQHALTISSLRGRQSIELCALESTPGWFMNFSGPNSAQVSGSDFSHQKFVDETLSLLTDATARGYKVIQFTSIHGLISPETPYGALHKTIIDQSATIPNIHIVVLPNCFGFDSTNRSIHLLIPTIVRAVNTDTKIEIVEKSKRLRFLPVSTLIDMLTTFISEPKQYWDIKVGVEIALSDLHEQIAYILRKGSIEGSRQYCTDNMVSESKLQADFIREVRAISKSLK